MQMNDLSSRSAHHGPLFLLHTTLECENRGSRSTSCDNFCLENSGVHVVISKRKEFLQHEVKSVFRFCPGVQK